MIVGFTGTREGMTQVQLSTVTRLLLGADEGHHGDCVGGDEQFHVICQELAIPIHLHPPEDDRWRAFCPGATRIEPPRPYLVRDRIIVDMVELLVAAPKEDEEPEPMRGQGTWYTVRYARRSIKPFRIVWPNGMPGRLL